MPGGQNLIVTILGMKGSGKSTLLRELIAERQRVLVIDSMGEHDDMPGALVREGAEACIDAMLARKGDRRYLIDCLLEEDEDGESREAMDVLAVAFEIPNQMIVIEETSFYTSPSFIPPEISNLIRYGRKRQLDLVFVARRPSEINRELTAQSDLLVTFRQTEPIDLQYLRARMGPQGDEAANLPEYHVLVAGDRSRVPLPILARMPVRHPEVEPFQEPEEENSLTPSETDT